MSQSEAANVADNEKEKFQKGIQRVKPQNQHAMSPLIFS